MTILTLLSEIEELPIPVADIRLSLLNEDDPLIKVYSASISSIPFLLLCRNQTYYAYIPDSDHSLDGLILLGTDLVLEYKLKNTAIQKIKRICEHTRLTEKLAKEITDESAAKI